jgi:hypothetical protein
MVRISFERIRVWIFEYLNRIFMMSIFIRILSDLADTIRIQIKKLENKSNISDIRPI